MSKLAIKGVFALIVAAVAYVAWQVKQQNAKKRLAEIDHGERCVACHGTSVTVTDGKARCNQCGYVSNLAFFQAAKVSDDDIAAVTKPETRGH